MKAGDLVRYTPTHNIDHIAYSSVSVGVVVVAHGGDITKLITHCGKILWAITKDCEVISESR